MLMSPARGIYLWWPSPGGIPPGACGLVRRQDGDSDLRPVWGGQNPLPYGSVRDRWNLPGFRFSDPNTVPIGIRFGPAHRGEAIRPSEAFGDVGRIMVMQAARPIAAGCDPDRALGPRAAPATGRWFESFEIACIAMLHAGLGCIICPQ